MVTLSVFYNIPRCDFKLFFLLRPDQCMNGGATISGSANSVAVGRSSNADPERIRLQTAGTRSGPKYTQHLDDPEDEVGCHLKEPLFHFLSRQRMISNRIVVAWFYGPVLAQAIRRRPLTRVVPQSQSRGRVEGGSEECYGLSGHKSMQIVIKKACLFSRFSRPAIGTVH